MNIDLKQVLALNTKILRTHHKLSQEQLADLCRLHRTQIGNIELAKKDVVLSTLERLATGLRVRVVDLLSPALSRDQIPRDCRFHNHSLFPK